MKILFLITSLKNFGGTERVVVNLANDLSHYCSIDIINRDTLKCQSVYDIASKVNVIALSGSLLKFRSELRKIIINNGYDLIVVHNMGKLSLLAATLFLPAEIKLWSYEHVARISRPKLVNFFAGFLYKKFSKIITITHNDAKTYLKKGYQTVVMYNPSPFEIQTAQEIKKNRIISIGRLTNQKGFDQLVLAWSLLEHKYDNWVCDIYGEGEDKEKLSLLIKQHNLRNINLLSPITQIDKVYKDSSFYVMSSRFEGLPMVLIEAQTFSLPIISFNCPHGPSEIITDKFDGLLVENGNVQKLAEAIEHLILNPKLKKEFSDNASISAQRFMKVKIINQWLEMLKIDRENM